MPSLKLSVLDAFDGPFEKLEPGKPIDVEPGKVMTARGRVSGYMLSHQVKDSFTATNRLLGANEEVYWIKSPLDVGGRIYPAGTIYIPAKKTTAPLLDTLAKELGLGFESIATKPSGDALKLRPVRVGLWDRYGGSMSSGWIRWMFEQQFQFPTFEVVYPPQLDAVRQQVVADGVETVRPFGEIQRAVEVGQRFVVLALGSEPFLEQLRLPCLLALVILQLGLMTRQIGLADLQGNLPLELRILRQIDFTHTARAQGTQDLVRSQAAVGAEGESLGGPARRLVADAGPFAISSRGSSLSFPPSGRGKRHLGSPILPGADPRWNSRWRGWARSRPACMRWEWGMWSGCAARWGIPSPWRNSKAGTWWSWEAVSAVRLCAR